jgi:transposase
MGIAMQKKLFQPHYDVVFKRKVIEEYLATGCTKMSLIRKYHIQFKSSIHTWMRVLGYKDPYAFQQIVRRPKFGVITYSCMPSKTTSNSSNDPRVLQKRIAELERQLQDEKLRSEAYQRMIEKAEKELNIAIRKKPFTR